MVRENIPPKIRIEVWKRDNWHCLYCGKPVFYAPSLKLLEKLNPGHKYFHPNGEDGSMLSLFHRSWSSVDHIIPVSKGGKNEMTNYATSCMDCNQKFNEKEVGNGKIKPREIKPSSWDGFFGLYVKLKKSI